jgi:hypothetical protein
LMCLLKSADFQCWIKLYLLKKELSNKVILLYVIRSTGEFILWWTRQDDISVVEAFNLLL